MDIPRPTLPPRRCPELKTERSGTMPNGRSRWDSSPGVSLRGARSSFGPRRQLSAARSRSAGGTQGPARAYNVPPLAESPRARWQRRGRSLHVDYDRPVQQRQGQHTNRGHREGRKSRKSTRPATNESANAPTTPVPGIEDRAQHGVRTRRAVRRTGSYGSTANLRRLFQSRR
jgi:hypothetical protein